MAIGVDLLDVRADLAPDRGARGEEWVVGGRGPVGVQPQDDAREMGVVGRRPAERVIDERGGEEWTIGKILQRTAPTDIADENVKFPVWPESHDAAVMASILGAIVRTRVARDRDVVRLTGAQLNEVAVEDERGPVPEEAIHAVTEQRHLGDHSRIGARAALRPEDERLRGRGEIRVQDKAQQAPVVSEVHGQIENRRGLNDTAENPFHGTGPFDHQSIGGTEPDDAHRLIEAADESRDLEIGIQDGGGNRVRGRHRRNDQQDRNGN